MVYESYYWKKELLKLADKLAKRKHSKKWWTESQHGTFEKEIMIGFYIIRKLIEAKKLTNSIVSTKIKGTKYPNNGKMVHRMNHHKFYEFYDFDNGKFDKFDLIFLCNQIVHSYVFSPFFEVEDEKNTDQKLRAIHFCSDDKRNDWLFEISIDSVIGIFRNLGNDYPSSGYYDLTRKKMTGQL